MKSYNARDLKNLNRKTVYKCIIDSPEQTVSCAQVARETGISMPTTLKVAEYLRQQGLLVDLGESQSGAIGRRPNLLRFNPNAYYAVGCAYNGQYLEVALVNMNFQIISANRIRTAVPLEELFAQTLPEALERVIGTSSLEEGSRLVGIGVALAVVTDTGRRRSQFPAPIIGIEDHYDFAPCCAQLSRQFGCAVYLENDVNAATLGEFKERGLTEQDDMAYITVGTGVGSGIILGGKLRRGRHNTAGEIGSMTFRLDCEYPQDGVGYLESQLSLSRLEELFGYRPQSEDGGNIATRLQAAEYIADYLALSILNMNAILDIDLFILGGFVIERLQTAVLNALRQRMERRSLNPIRIDRETSQFSTAKGMGSIVIERMLDDILSGAAEEAPAKEPAARGADTNYAMDHVRV